MAEPALQTHLTEYGFLWGPEVNPYPVSGLMTYGPLGKALKSAIEASFRSLFDEEGFVEIETPLLTPTSTWEASGHLSRFKDEMYHTSDYNGRPLTARTEQATTIYPFFNLLRKYFHDELPFKVSQSGLVLPNDRQTSWQTRTHQYTSHEGHVFVNPSDTNPDEVIRYLQQLAFEFMSFENIESGLTLEEKQGKHQPFYAEAAFGLYDETGLELLGIQYRGSNDFVAHSNETGKKLQVNGNYPEVFEISFSSDRPFYSILRKAFTERDGKPLLAVPYPLAPVGIQVFPYREDGETMNTAELVSMYLEDITEKAVPIVSKGSLGRRYVNADAIGTPYTIMVEDNHYITIRDRDTTALTDVPIHHLRQLMGSDNKIDQMTLIGNLLQGAS